MAGLGIGIQVDDRKVQRMLTIAPQKIKAAKNEILNRGSIMTQAEMRVNAPVFDGELRRSIRPKWQSADTVVVFSDSKHAPVMELGRKPGGRLPPYKEGTPLAKWVRIKMGQGVPPFLVARSIARKGTKGKHFAQKTYVTMKPAINSMASQIIAKTIKGL